MSRKSMGSDERRQRREERRRLEVEAQLRHRRRALQLKVLGGFGGALVVLLGVFLISGAGGGSPSGAGEYPYAVGSPGAGETAPPIELLVAGGESFDLADQNGRSTLLYFQEGLMCQPCWDQITDLEPRMDELRKLGVDQLVSITTDPSGAIEQKVVDEGIETPVLADEYLTISRAYETNQYGMMGESRNGHSFVLVAPNRKIRWRADYGGDPNYFMYIPVPNLLADIREGLEAERS